MLNPKETLRKKVYSGGGMNQSQAIDYQAQLFYQALLSIDSDDVLRKAGKTRADLANLLYDDEIDQAISRRKEILKTSKFTLTPSNSRVAKFVFSQLEEHLQEILSASISSKMYGYDVAEMLWDSTGQLNTVTSVVSKPLEWFDINNMGEVKYLPNNGQPPITISKQDDFMYRYLVQRHEPSFKQPKGRALLSRVYWLWYFKTNGWRFWSKYLERFGSPLVIGKSDAETQAEITEFAGVLLSAHNSGVIAVGSGDDVQIAGASGSGEAFARYDEAVNRRITTYLLGQTLTSGTDTGGTYGQGMVHQAQQEIIFNSDREQARIAVQRFIDVVCYANGFEPPTFAWVTDTGLQTDRATRDVLLYQQGLRFTQSYYADIYDLEDNHFWLVENPPQVGGVNTPVAQLPTQANAGNDMPFTNEQQALENLADDLLAEKHLPMPADKLKACILQATSPTHLFELLADTVGHDLDNNAFGKVLAESLALASARGYIDSEAE